MTWKGLENSGIGFSPILASLPIRVIRVLRGPGLGDATGHGDVMGHAGGLFLPRKTRRTRIKKIGDMGCGTEGRFGESGIGFPTVLTSLLIRVIRVLRGPGLGDATGHGDVMGRAGGLFYRGKRGERG